MDEAESERRWSEGPRVRVRSRVVRRSASVMRPSGSVELTSHAVRSSLRAAEVRFLLLQSRSAERPSSEILLEYLGILADLRVAGNRLQDMSGRRDLSYLTDRRLTVLHHHCIWLTRRVSAEFLLLLQVQIEQELKRAIAPETYQLYLRVQDVGDASREVETLDDRGLMCRLRDGTLLGEILDQIFLQGDRPSAPEAGAATGAADEGGTFGS